MSKKVAVAVLFILLAFAVPALAQESELAFVGACTTDPKISMSVCRGNSDGEIVQLTKPLGPLSDVQLFNNDTQVFFSAGYNMWALDVNGQGLHRVETCPEEIKTRDGYYIQDLEGFLEQFPEDQRESAAYYLLQPVQNDCGGYYVLQGLKWGGVMQSPYSEETFLEEYTLTVNGKPWELIDIWSGEFYVENTVFLEDGTALIYQAEGMPAPMKQTMYSAMFHLTEDQESEDFQIGLYWNNLDIAEANRVGQ